MPTSVRWVSNQNSRWGSATPAEGTIRLSDKLRPMPQWVIDYVLLRRPLPESVTRRVPIPEDPKARLMLLVAAVLAVSTVGLVVGLWGRWRATLASKRVQVAIRRRVFEHAVRLPLNRGSWHVTAKGAGRSYAVYRFMVDPGGWVPSFAANLGNTEAVTGTFKAVEKESQRRARDRVERASAKPGP